MPPYFISDATDTATTWTVWASDATTSTVNTNFVWHRWCVTGSTSTDVWVTWNVTAGAANVTTVYRAPAPAPETEEQRVARLETAARQERERVEAQERAEQLLRDHLTIEQAAQLVQGNYFEVISESGKRYRVQRGYSKNVLLVDGGKPVERYCIHPDYGVPNADVMLAQKLMLETAERDFLRIANRHPAHASVQ